MQVQVAKDVTDETQRVVTQRLGIQTSYIKDMRAQLERQHEVMQGQDQPIGHLQEIQHHIDQLKGVANQLSKNRHLVEHISQ